jgi:hypothetical protein
VNNAGLPAIGRNEEAIAGRLGNVTIEKAASICTPAANGVLEFPREFTDRRKRWMRKNGRRSCKRWSWV